MLAKLIKFEDKMNKIVSVDFLPLSRQTGISTFNASLGKIFQDKITFLTFYKAEYISKNEINLKLKRMPFWKPLNYLLGYRLSSHIIKSNLKKLNLAEDDILILHSASFLRSRLPPSKKILVMHQSLDIMMVNRSSFAGSKNFLSHVMKTIDYFIVPTESDKIQAINKFNLDGEKIITIPHVSRVPIKKENKIFSKDLVMITRLDNKQKSIDKVISAMRKLPDWRLHIYGDGEDRNLLNNLIYKLNLKNVFLHGRTNNIIDALDTCSIHIMSSNFEGFGITNIEALSRGLPLIIRNTFPAANDILNSNNGILIDDIWSDDTFIKAVNTISENYTYYSQNALASAKKYQLMAVSEIWHKII